MIQSSCAVSVAWGNYLTNIAYSPSLPFATAMPAMGREFIGECPVSDKGPEFEIYEGELAIKYIKQECGQPPEGVDVQITSEGSEVGDGSEQVSYPVISVVWDDYVTEYPDEYIAKCIEAFEKFDLPDGIYQEGQKNIQLFCEPSDVRPKSDDQD